MANSSPHNWRRMAQPDLASVERVGDVVHPAYPEDAAVFIERLQLYPAGCFVLAGEHGVTGYAISHPWLFGRPPALNTKLGCLPARADTFYIHDVALMPGMRGAGLGRKIVELLARQAKTAGLHSMSLVALGKSQRFWSNNGFEVVTQDTIRADLASYGAAAAFMARRLP